MKEIVELAYKILKRENQIPVSVRIEYYNIYSIDSDDNRGTWEIKIIKETPSCADYDDEVYISFSGKSKKEVIKYAYNYLQKYIKIDCKYLKNGFCNSKHRPYINIYGFMHRPRCLRLEDKSCCYSLNERSEYDR